MDMHTQESLSKRIGRFVAWVGAMFCILTAILVSQRLSSDSLALLVGLTCGVSMMLPTLLLGVWLWRREESRRKAMQSTPNPSPPVVVVTPQALPPAYLPQSPPPQLSQAWPWQQMAASKRTFTVVGGEE